MRHQSQRNWIILRNAIDGRHVKSLLDNFLDKTFHCNSEGVNLAVENLNSIFDLSAFVSNLKHLE
jgi:hypothetical protein